jgi:hypothetical protein
MVSVPACRLKFSACFGRFVEAWMLELGAYQ